MNEQKLEEKVNEVANILEQNNFFEESKKLFEYYLEYKKTDDVIFLEKLYGYCHVRVLGDLKVENIKSFLLLKFY